MLLEKSAQNISKQEINSIEKELDIKLPEELINFYLTNNGGIPVRPCFLSEENESTIEISAFYSLKHKFNENINTLEDSYKNFLSRKVFAKKFLPFAFDWGSNQICINLQTNDVVVIYMDLGEIKENSPSIKYLINGFKNFIDGLSENSDEDDV